MTWRDWVDPVRIQWAKKGLSAGVGFGLGAVVFGVLIGDLTLWPPGDLLVAAVVLPSSYAVQFGLGAYLIYPPSEAERACWRHIGRWLLGKEGKK